MNKIREILETKVKILSEKKTKDGDIMQIFAPWIVTGRMNQNKRLYPLALIQREIAKVQAKIKAGAMISSADHPAIHTSLADASHIIRKLEIDKSGKGWMTATVLPTTKGKNVMTIIKAGGQLGISARGVGDVRADGTVENSYQLLGCDIVTNPAEPEAVFDKANICESLEFSEEENEDPQLDKDDIAKELKRRAGLEEALYDLLHTSFLKACEDDCWYGNFEQYKAQYEKGMREVMGLSDPSGDIEQAEKKLTEQQVKDRTWSHFDEARRAGFVGTFDDWKKKYPRLVEKASEPIKISEEMAPKPKEPFKSRATWEEIQLSGFKGTMEEYEKQCPNISIIKPKPIQKKIVETLEAEAERIYSALKKDTPNSSITLESVRQMLEKEEIVRSDKRIRKRAINIVSRDLAGTVPQATIEKMVAVEIEALKRQRAEMRERNWAAYEKLLKD